MVQAEDHEDLRQAVRELCQLFPDSYWRILDQQRAYSEAFVEAITSVGYLGALIPREKEELL
jgi:acyl-CoA dehydrogenase